MPKTTTKSERLELALAISNITNKQDAFIKAVETLDEYKTEILTNLDLEIETRKIDLQDLEEAYKKAKKDGQIEADQFLAEYRYKGAMEIIAELHDEVPIKKDDLAEMEEEITSLRQDQTEKIQKAVQEEHAKGKEALNSAIKNATLTHKAETAELNATVKQQVKEIATLQDAIDNLKVELAEQRKLTKDVAVAGRAAAITQNLGK